MVTQHLRWLHLLILFVSVICGLLISVPASADIAPPQRPPGSNLFPGEEPTRVQMLEETVLLDVQVAPWPGERLSDWVRDWAKVTANFIMLNRGQIDETMQVRFPLTDPSGMGDGRGEYPEIEDLRVWVDGIWVVTTRIEDVLDRGEVVWAGFDVTFPAGVPVEIEVRYSQRATGYHPQSEFVYFLETGAGWKDTIGKGELIVRLPYTASAENVLMQYSSEGVRFQGAEARWSFENLEPDWEDNLRVQIIEPGYWFAVLDARKAVEDRPADGDAWGGLARALKLVSLEYKGWVRDDQAGEGLFQASVEAYEKAVELAPGIAKWHAGYAELLWHKIWFQPDYGDPTLTTILEELETALELDPGNEQAWEILGQMRYSMPFAVAIEGSDVDYLHLTATVQPSPTPSPTETSTPEVTVEPVPSWTASSITATPLEPSLLDDTPESGESDTPFSCLGGMLIGAVGPWMILVISRQGLRRDRRSWEG